MVGGISLIWAIPNNIVEAQPAFINNNALT